MIRLTISAGLLALVLSATPALSQFSKATVLMTGKVTDSESGQPIKAKLRFLDPSGAEKNKVFSNSEGKYTAVLTPGINYTLQSASGKRYVKSEPLPVAASETSVQAKHDVTLDPIKAGRVMFNGPCFDFSSVTPRSDAMNGLTEVGKAMGLNEEIEVTVDVSCDEPFDDKAIAADQGTQRAEAVKRVLTSNGATARRIILKAKNPPPPPPPAPEPAAGKGKKKAKPVVKKAPAKKTKGKKGPAAEPPNSKVSITITSVHSEDE